MFTSHAYPYWQSWSFDIYHFLYTVFTDSHQLHVRGFQSWGSLLGSSVILSSPTSGRLLSSVFLYFLTDTPCVLPLPTTSIQLHSHSPSHHQEPGPANSKVTLVGCNICKCDISSIFHFPFYCSRTFTKHLWLFWLVIRAVFFLKSGKKRRQRIWHLGKDHSIFHHNEY